jgi:hypothetical protein
MTEHRTPYPVRVDGASDPEPVSRWLWLVISTAVWLVLGAGGWSVQRQWERQRSHAPA